MANRFWYPDKFAVDGEVLLDSAAIKFSYLPLHGLNAARWQDRLDRAEKTSREAWLPEAAEFLASRVTRVDLCGVEGGAAFDPARKDHWMDVEAILLQLFVAYIRGGFRAESGAGGVAEEREKNSQSGSPGSSGGQSGGA